MPGELTLDLVNYHYDLACDAMTSVASADFRVRIPARHFAVADNWVAESIRYDEGQPHNVARQPLGRGGRS